MFLKGPLHVPQGALNLSSSWVTLRGLPDPFLRLPVLSGTFGRFREFTGVSGGFQGLPVVFTVSPLLPEETFSTPVGPGEPPPFPVLSRGFNRHPVIRYPSTGPTGDFRRLPVPSAPAGKTILPHPAIGPASGHKNSGNTTLPEHLYLIMAVGCQPHIITL